MNKLLIIVLIAASLIWSSLIWSSQKYDQNSLERFTGIFGINLKGYESKIGESLLILVRKELGEATGRKSGDASTGVESICYLWPDGSSVLEFDEQEAGVTFTIRKQNDTDHLNCLPLSWKTIGKKKLEVGGLRLGLTRDEVKKLIGLPTKTAKDTMYFNYEGTSISTPRSFPWPAIRVTN